MATTIEPHAHGYPDVLGEHFTGQLLTHGDLAFCAFVDRDVQRGGIGHIHLLVQNAFDRGTQYTAEFEWPGDGPLLIGGTYSGHRQERGIHARTWGIGLLEGAVQGYPERQARHVLDTNVPEVGAGVGSRAGDQNSPCSERKKELDTRAFPLWGSCVDGKVRSEVHRQRGGWEPHDPGADPIWADVLQAGHLRVRYLDERRRCTGARGTAAQL